MAKDHTVHKLADGETFQVVGDRVLVQMDPEDRVTESGVIHIPETAHETIIGTGTILAYGYMHPKKKVSGIPIPGLSVGDKCAFIKFLKNQNANQMFRRTHQDDVVLLQSKDIMFTWGQDEPHRVK